MNSFKLARLLISKTRGMSSRKSSDYAAFKTILQQSKNIVALTGAGVSAESGIGTFRGPSGLWRTHKATDLATVAAFQTDPSLVWEFYHWRRETAFNANPNNADLALAKFEASCQNNGKDFHLITQNVDGLHIRAGSKNVIELHGCLEKVICTKCKTIEIDRASPICEGLRGRGDPNLKDKDAPSIPIDDLPKCKKCNSLARPYIVWFGEQLDREVLKKTRHLVENCDLFLVIGTSSVVYPAASFAMFVAERGKPVAEFNIDEQPASDNFQFYFPGKCGTTLPKALGMEM